MWQGAWKLAVAWDFNFSAAYCKLWYMSGCVRTLSKTWELEICILSCVWAYIFSMLHMQKDILLVFAHHYTAWSFYISLKSDVIPMYTFSPVQEFLFGVAFYQLSYTHIPCRLRSSVIQDTTMTQTRILLCTLAACILVCVKMYV